MFLEKYFGKNLTPETDQIALSQSDYRIFKLTFSPDQIDKIASFLTCWYKFRKLKVDWTFFGWASSKIDMANLFSGLRNWIFSCWYRFIQIKMWLKIWPRGWHGQKWVWSVLWWDSKIDCISEEWTDWINFLRAGTNSGKLKVYLIRIHTFDVIMRL